MSAVNLRDLAKPFPATDVRVKPQTVVKGQPPRALAVFYIDARAVMQRLDDVVGPENWQVEYRPGPAGGVICRLLIRVNGEWIYKENGAENTKVEAVKGGLSDAIRRAAVCWGIGRYLYSVPATWFECELNSSGGFRKWVKTPTLPAAFLPNARADEPIPHIDLETGEIFDDEPLPPARQETIAPPPPAADPPRNGDGDDVKAIWSSLPNIMRENGLVASDLAKVLPDGRFTMNALEQWLHEHPGVHIGYLIEEAKARKGMT